MLLKLTPVVNFINVLRVNFLYECRFGSFFKLRFGFGEKFVQKAAHKMLLKLTPAAQCLDLVFSVWKMINVWDNKTDPGNQGHSWSDSSFRDGKKYLKMLDNIKYNLWKSHTLCLSHICLVDRKKAHNGVRELSVFNTILAFENPLKRLKQVVCEYQEIWQIKRFCQFISPNRHLLICPHFYPFFDAVFFESRVGSS